MERADDASISQAGSASGVKKANKVAKKKRPVPPPSLEVLLYNLESANSHPSYALDYLKDLACDADKVIENIDHVEEHFAPGQDEAEIQMNIETFMQNT